MLWFINNNNNKSTNNTNTEEYISAARCVDESKMHEHLSRRKSFGTVDSMASLATNDNEENIGPSVQDDDGSQVAAVGADEEDNAVGEDTSETSMWESKDKCFFILSDAGKPIFASVGEDTQRHYTSYGSC